MVPHPWSLAVHDDHLKTPEVLDLIDAAFAEGYAAGYEDARGERVPVAWPILVLTVATILFWLVLFTGVAG